MLTSGAFSVGPPEKINTYTCRFKPLHNGAMFVDLRDTLAETGGRLLVSVLRDMRAGKVSVSLIQCGDGT